MSSTFKINKICEYCGDLFIAQKTTTRYCGSSCASRAYKRRKRDEKIANAEIINTSNNSSKIIVHTYDATINDKEYLSIKELCLLIGVSRWTIYRLIKKGELPVLKIGRRNIIKKEDVEKIFR